MVNTEGKRKPQAKKSRFLQQEAILMGIGNVGQWGGQRRAHGQKVAGEQRPGGRKGASPAYIWGETSQAKGTMRTNALRWEHAKLVSRTVKRPMCLEQKRAGGVKK